MISQADDNEALNIQLFDTLRTGLRTVVPFRVAFCIVVVKVIHLVVFRVYSDDELRNNISKKYSAIVHRENSLDPVESNVPR